MSKTQTPAAYKKQPALGTLDRKYNEDPDRRPYESTEYDSEEKWRDYNEVPDKWIDYNEFFFLKDYIFGGKRYVILIFSNLTVTYSYMNIDRVRIFGNVEKY